MSERSEWLAKEPDLVTSKKLKIAAWVVTALVLVLVGLMRNPALRIPLPEGVSLDFLPLVNALVNSLVAICLVLAIVAVKYGKITMHRAFMLTAMGLSVVFLLTYVAYHFTNYEVKFGDLNLDGTVSPEEAERVGAMRSVYLTILITHIVAAAVSLPLILLTFTAAWTNRFRDHVRMARWVFPIWLYVAVTGPICYVMLRPYYS